MKFSTNSNTILGTRIKRYLLQQIENNQGQIWWSAFQALPWTRYFLAIDLFKNICNKTFHYIPKSNDKIVALTILNSVGQARLDI